MKGIPSACPPVGIPDSIRWRLRRGMKVRLTEDKYGLLKGTGSKAGDIVKITSITAMGYPSDGYENDYEVIRVSNGQASWRVSRGQIEEIK